MKTRNHISKSMICLLMVVLCIAAFSACNLYPSKECDHKWSGWTATKDATCEVAGEESRVCEKCGQIETSPIEATGHKWDDATCTAPKTCTVCNKTEGSVLAHVYDKEIVKDEALKSAATQESAAVYYKSCSCGAISKNDAETFVHGTPLEHKHAYTSVVTEPTCLVDGYTTYTCACGDTYTANTVAALGHKGGTATCTELAKCDACGLEYGELLAHAWVDATCFEAKYCSSCGLTEGEKLAHVGGTATCTELAKCDACGLEYGELLAHAWVDATCTEAKHCSSCGLTEGEKLAHVGGTATCTTQAKCDTCGNFYGDFGAHDWEAATCTEAKNCRLCGSFEGEALGHTGGTATCTHKAICERCSMAYGETVAHTYDKNADPLLYLAKEATCTNANEYYYSCSACGKCHDGEGAETFFDGEVLEHEYVWVSNGDGTHTGTCQNGCEGTVTNACAGGAATCTQKAVCEICQEYYGAALGHAWVDSEIITAPTCTSVGQKEQTCQCGASTTVSIPVLQHTYSSESVSPTCVAQGYTVYTCTGCGYSYKGDYQDALGHSYGEWTIIKDATCTATGSQTHTCDCGAVETQIIQARGHNHTAVVTDPTCVQKGYTTYTCSCGDSYVGDEVAPTGHAWNINAPTCTEDQVCDTCGERVDAIGHSYKLSGSTAATCVAAAANTYTCEHCKDSYTESVGTTIAHDVSDVTPELVLNEGQTCIYTEHYKCKDCGADVVGETVEKHEKYTASIQTAATCTAEGVKILTCAECGFTKEEIIPVDTTLGHTWVLGEVSDGKRTDTCACGENKVVTVVTGDQANKVDDLKDTELSIGDANINFGNAADSIGNQTSNDVTIGAGTLDEKEKQDVLDDLDDEKLEQIGNNPIYNFTVTDTENNLITDFEGHVVTITIPYELSEGEDVDSIAIWFINDKGEVESIPATYNNGYVTFTTNHFSYYTVTRLTPAQRCEVYGHNFKESTVAPTCTEQGYTLQYCIRCRHSQKVNYVDPLEHKYEAKTEKAATCTENGLIKYTCSTCKETYEETIPAIKHNYEFFSETKGSCTVAGVITYKCANCQAVKTEQTTTTGHSCVAVQTIASTCTTQGYTVYACQNEGCEYSYNDDYQDVVDHEFGDWAVVKASTCTVEGEERRQCANCEHYETQKIAVVAHNYVATVTAPTCDQAGYTTYTCSLCQNSYTDNFTDPIGHKYEATWDWADDKATATITITCQNEGCQYNATPFVKEIKTECTVFDSTVNKEGRKEYHVRFEFDGHSFADEKQEKIPVKEHSHEGCEMQYNKFNHWYKCPDCKGNSGKIPHEFDEGTVVKEATCKTEGEIVYKCECGYEKTERISKSDNHTTGTNFYRDGATHWNVCTECGEKVNEAEHSWDSGAFTKEVTCTENGIITYRCACGASKAEEVPALGHTEEVLAGQNATCTENGLSDGVWCSACGEILVAQEEIPALGHTEEVLAGQNATCTENGLSDGVWCPTCGEILVAQEEIPAPGHTFQDGACTVCGQPDSCELHSYEIDLLNNPARFEKTWGVCTVCGYIADEHTHKIEAGKCIYCDYEFFTTDVVSKFDADGDGANDILKFSAALPEKFNDAIRIDAFKDAVADGNHMEYDEIRAGSATQMPYPNVYCYQQSDNELIYNIVVEEAGIYELAVHVRLKDQKERGATFVINRGAENEQTFSVSYGWSTFDEASMVRDNDYLYSAYYTGLSFELQEGENTIIITCTDGIVKTQLLRDLYLLKSGSVCKHEYTETEKVEPTCTTEGYIVKVCGLCQNSVTKKLPALGHTFSEFVETKAPTCTEYGEMSATCIVCGEFVVEYIPKLDHIFQDGVCVVCGLSTSCEVHSYEIDILTNPARFEKTWGVCTVCGYIADEHTHKIEAGKCIYCDYEFFTTDVVSKFDADGDGANDILKFSAALPEKFNDAIRLDAYKDSTGDHITYDEIAAKNPIQMPYAHVYCMDGVATSSLNFILNVESAGTYEVAVHIRLKDQKDRGATFVINEGTAYEQRIPVTYGWASDDEAWMVRDSDYLQSAYYTGLSFELQEGENTISIKIADGVHKVQHFRDLYLLPLDTCAHEYTETERVEPTCTTEGYIVKVCGLCQKSITQKIPVLSHTFGEFTETKAPTCTEKGEMSATCAVCGGVISQYIPELGHTWGQFVETKAPTCTEYGEISATCTACGETVIEYIPAYGHSVQNGVCTICGLHVSCELHSYEIDAVTNPARFEKTWGVCTVCGDIADEHTHKIEAGKCVYCDYEFYTTDVVSKFDADGDGANDILKFSAALPEKFNDAIRIDAFKDAVADGNHIEYDAVRANQPYAMPYPHVYCMDGSDDVLIYNIVVEEAGTYEVAVHIRLKDQKERGATFVINEGTAYEQRIPVTYGWASDDEAWMVRDSDYLQSAYYTGLSFELQEGENTISIKIADGVHKVQHFRDLYLLPLDTCAHEYTEIERVEPTCTTNGYVTKVCGLCDKVKTFTLYAPGHTSGEWVVELEPTCTTEGEMRTTCTVCGEVVSQILPAFGHSFGNWTEIVAPTCTEYGEWMETCYTCGETQTGTIYPNGHSWDTWEDTKLPTCTENGERVYHCACGETMTEILWNFGHTLKDEVVVKEATCTENGEMVGTCITCGETISVVLGATGHNTTYERIYFADVGIACGGYVRVYTCTVCGETVNTTFNEYCYWSYTGIDEATGANVYSCLNCGAVKHELSEKQSTDVACKYVVVETRKYYVADELVLTVVSHIYHEDHEWQYEFILLGNSCDDGYTVKETCKTCDRLNEFTNYGHNRYRTEYYDLTEYGACHGYVEKTVCPCGEYSGYNVNYCANSTVSNESFIDENGVEHTIRVYQCSTCGLTRTRDRYYEKEGCFEYRYYLYTFTIGETEICSYIEKSLSSTHHDYEYTYTFLDETNQNCTAGVIVKETCRNCDHVGEWTDYGHNVIRTVYYKFTNYGACYGYLEVYSCACGQECGTNRDYCAHNYVSDDTYTDEAGFEHRVEVYECPNCGLQRTSDYYDVKEGCYVYRYYTERYTIGETEIGSCSWKSTHKTQHEYQYTYTFQDEENRNCEAGVTVVTTCKNCDYYSESYRAHHQSDTFFHSDWYDCCEGHNVRAYGCPCGEGFDIQFDEYTFNYNEETQTYTCENCALTVSKVVEVTENGCSRTEKTTFVVCLSGEEKYRSVRDEICANHNYNDVKASVTDGKTVVSVKCSTCGDEITLEMQQAVLENHDGTYYYDYTFVPEISAQYVIQSYSDGDTYVHLYELVDGELIQLSYNDDYYNNQFYLATNLEAGKTYVYRIRFYHSTQSGTINFTLAQFASEVETNCKHNSINNFATLMEGATSCTDGVFNGRLCPECGRLDQMQIKNDHNTRRIAYYNFGEYGACYGYLEIYSCACGENTGINRNYCSHNHVSSSTYVDEAGITHYVEVYECPTCGLTRTRDYYDVREGCYTYRYSTESYAIGGVEIGSGSWRSQQNTHHEYEYTYTFADEANQNCEAGVTVVTTCKNCDYHGENYYTYHATFRTEYYDFTEYGACYGYLEVLSCACGENTGVNRNYCSNNYVSDSTYVDEAGIKHTLQVRECPTCGLTRTRDYYDQKEGCYIYRYYTESYAIGETEIGSGSWKSHYDTRHEYERTYTFADEANQNCEAGVTVVTTCKNCDYHGENYYTYHATFRTEYYDFTEYGACYGYLEVLSCACGENTGVNRNYCSNNYVSDSTYVDEAGIKHTLQVRECPTCGLTRTRDYYDQKEGCYIYRYYTESYAIGETEIGSGSWKSHYDTRHEYERTYTFADEANQNCEAGVTVVTTCKNCDYHSESYYTHHATFRTEYYDFTEYGAEGGYAYVYACPCGYSTSVEFGFCSHGSSYNTNEYTDEEGIRWYVETWTTTSCDCDIRFDRAYRYEHDTENCLRICYYEESLSVGNALIELGARTTTEVYHDYEIRVELKEGATDCYEGVIVTEDCRYCEEEYTHTEYHHYNVEIDRFDLTQYGAVCEGYAVIKGCACGYNRSLNISNSDCAFEHRNTTNWIEGAINNYQYTAEGHRSFYSYAYTYTCAVTDPTQCGFVIRYSTYWRKNADCSATQCLTVQFGYDEATGTCQHEVTYELAGRTYTYHNYERTSVDNGNGHVDTCTDCGSYYSYINYYNEQGVHIKQQEIWENKLDDGCRKYRESTYEYAGTHEGRWGNYQTSTYHKYIEANDVETWDKYEYTYAEYEAPFGENGYVRTEKFSNSNGYSRISEYTYTHYKGYEFTLINRYTEGEYWNQYTYTYDFTNGCKRWEVFTDSNGSNSESGPYDAHPTSHYVTITPPTCTQYGAHGYSCPVCEAHWGDQPVSPLGHNWVLLSDNLYYCRNCGLQNINGANGDIVMEDLTDKYGNSEAYVIGYWMNTTVHFTPYVTIYLNEPIITEWGEEDAFILFLTDDQFHFVEDEYVGLYVTVADIQAAVEALCADYGVETFTPDMYAVSISFVPDGADDNFDYAIVFDNLPGSEEADNTIQNDEFVVDYVYENGYVEYTIISNETAEWVFESHVSGGDPYAHLFNANGNELITNDDGAGNLNFRITYTLQAGVTYVLRVRWLNNQSSGYIATTFQKGHTHTVEIIPATVTCTTSGYTEGQRCTECGATIVQSYWTSALGHTVSEWVEISSPTCSASGEKQGTCTVCGETAYEYLSPLAHTLGEWVETIAPTCTVNGERMTICSVCNQNVYEWIAPLGHTIQDGVCIVCGQLPSCEGEHSYEINAVTNPARFEKTWGVCTVCGYVADEHTHKVENGKCIYCDYEFYTTDVVSQFDADGDGANDILKFSAALPEKFNDAIRIDAFMDAAANQNYMEYDEIRSGSGIRPYPHVYCYDMSDDALEYTITVEEAGVYELAVHVRLKDQKERGATFVINGGTANEHSFSTTYSWSTVDEAMMVYNNDLLMSAYYTGFTVELQEGENTIIITNADGIYKNQHFRDLYLLKVEDGE